MISQEAIKKEVRDWSKEVLETDKPICPYAKKTWANNKVKVVLSKCEYWSDLVDIGKNFPKDKDVIIYCDTNSEVEVYNFDSRISLLNCFLMIKTYGLWVFIKNMKKKK